MSEAPENAPANPVKKQEIVYIPLDEIVPYEDNPRVNAPAVPSCMESIAQFGFRGAIDLDENKVIIRGHTRLMALKNLRAENRLPANVADGRIPCIIHTDLSPQLVRALRVADNKISELSQWDDERLVAELLAMPDINFEDFGFDMDALLGSGSGTTGKTDPDSVPETPENPVSMRGEVYQLGDHRLMCGDSTSKEDVARLMDGTQADCVITDPPYNVNIGARGETYERIADETGKDYKCGHEDRRILNDNMSDEAFDEFLEPVMQRLAESLKPGGACYVWHASRTQRAFEDALNKAGLHVREQLIWVKDNFTLGRQDYQWRHEPCFYLWKDGAGHKWSSDRKQTTVLEYPKPTRSELHPTMKPVDLIAYQMGNSTEPGNLVLDLFGGSGTTMIAAEQSGRKSCLMELDPHYCDVIRRRWAEFVHGEGCDWVALTPAVGGSEAT